MTENDKPLREMDLAFLEMFDLLLDIMVRMGVYRASLISGGAWVKAKGK